MYIFKYTNILYIYIYIYIYCIYEYKYIYIYIATMSKYMYMYISRCDVGHMNEPYHTYEHDFHGTWPVNDIATHCNTLPHTATHCNTLQHTAERCSTLQHTTTYSSTNRMPPPEFGGPTKKQKTCEQTHHAASCCNTLQHTAIYYNTLVNERECDLQRSRAMPSIKDMRTNKRINLQHAATHCHILQHRLRI